MAHIELAAAAVEDLTRIRAVLSLPDDTFERVRASMVQLAQFPRLGAELGGRWAPLRFMIGPWRWMLLIYIYEESADRVVVVTIQDARATSSPTFSRGP